MWYWRQVIVAIILGAMQDLRSHKVAGLMAVITGWVSLMAYFAIVAWPLLKIMDGYIVGVLGFAATGWVVGRLNRPHRTAMVMIYVLSILLVSDVPHFLVAAYAFRAHPAAMLELVKGAAFVFFGMRELPMLIGGLLVPQGASGCAASSSSREP